MKMHNPPHPGEVLKELRISAIVNAQIASS